MESSLTPREIQARVRAGETLEEVARAAGVIPDWVEPFAVPVLAEREFIAQQARSQQVRRGGETIAHRTLGQVVEDRLTSRGVDTDTVAWDAWRLEGRRWQVLVSYDSGKAHREARFVYEASGRFSVADDDDARWLVGLHSPSHGPQPGRRRRDEEEPTVDLNDDLALVRIVQPRADSDDEVDDAFTEGELAEVDGVYDIIPTASGELDVLYDMLSGFDEDSVQIYAGLIRDELGAEQEPAESEPELLDEPVAEEWVAETEPDAETGSDAAASETEPEPEPEAAAPARAPRRPAPEPVEPEQPSLVDEPEPAPEPAPKPKRRRGRAEVPSWDEIMFGSPKNPR
jgi:hypothetical protein